VDFLVTKIKDLNDKVIPFFEKIPLQGLKSKNLSDFHKAALAPRLLCKRAGLLRD